MGSRLHGVQIGRPIIASACAGPSPPVLSCLVWSGLVWSCPVLSCRTRIQGVQNARGPDRELPARAIVPPLSKAWAKNFGVWKSLEIFGFPKISKDFQRFPKISKDFQTPKFFVRVFDCRTCLVAPCHVCVAVSLFMSLSSACVSVSECVCVFVPRLSICACICSGVRTRKSSRRSGPHAIWTPYVLL